MASHHPSAGAKLLDSKNGHTTTATTCHNLPHPSAKGARSSQGTRHHSGHQADTPRRVPAHSRGKARRRPSPSPRYTAGEKTRKTATRSPPGTTVSPRAATGAPAPRRNQTSPSQTAPPEPHQTACPALRSCTTSGHSRARTPDQEQAGKHCNRHRSAAARTATDLSAPTRDNPRVRHAVPLCTLPRQPTPTAPTAPTQPPPLLSVACPGQRHTFKASPPGSSAPRCATPRNTMPRERSTAQSQLIYQPFLAFTGADGGQHPSAAGAAGGQHPPAAGAGGQHPPAACAAGAAATPELGLVAVTLADTTNCSAPEPGIQSLMKSRDPSLISTFTSENPAVFSIVSSSWAGVAPVTQQANASAV
mmetsp:Transcript_6949/g.14912  ORF Transcript_6949/g.14912 Transcript_6949/m.14912 type:complete len:362 (+) Transcript_6949:670-1755(+)